MTITGTGRLCFTSLSPSSFSTASKTEMPLGSAAPPIAAAVGSGFGVGGFSNFALGVRLREELWRAKVEAAAVRYSENPCTETMAAYRRVLERFADLVLSHKAGKRRRRTSS